ncbi:MAG: ATP-binding protein [Nitrospiria bacterium]
MTAVDTQYREQIRSYQILGSLQAEIFCINLKKTITYVNPLLCRTLGYTPNEIEGKHIGLLHGKTTDLKSTPIPWKKLLRGNSWRGQTVIRKKDGKTYLADLTISPIYSAGRQTIGFAGIQKEVTPVQHNNKPTGLQYKKALDISKDGLLIQDKIGDLLLVNQALCQTFGFSEAEIIAQGLQKFITPEGLAILHDKIMPESVQRGAAKGEVEGIKEGNGLFQLSITMICVRDNDAVVQGFVSLYEDLSREKEIQHQRSQSKKLAAMGEMLAGVAHELNNPLTSVVGFSELLLRKRVGGDIKRQLKKISSEAMRTSKIVQNLLSVVRSHKPEKTLVGLNGVIHNVLELKRHQLKVDNIRTLRKLASDDSLPRVIGDYQQLVEVLLNLVNNAHQAMVSYRGKGTLTIKTECIGNNIFIRVSDTGPGIPKEIHTKLFQPFFTTKPTGSGLGLHISHDIIKMHSGDITFETAMGRGTKFVIRLPIAPDQFAHPTEAFMQAAVRPDQLKILVVDDEKMILDLYFHLLTQLGHNPQLVKSVSEAIERLSRTRYDLIISDIKIPGMNGEKFYNFIKRRHPSLTDRIIFVTGDTLSTRLHKYNDV